MNYSKEIKKAKELLEHGSFNLCSMQCGKIIEIALKQIFKEYLAVADTTERKVVKDFFSESYKKDLEKLTLGEIRSLNIRTKALSKMVERFERGNKELDLINLKSVLRIRNRATHGTLGDLEEEAGSDAHIIYGTALKMLNTFNFIRSEVVQMEEEGHKRTRVGRRPEAKTFIEIREITGATSSRGGLPVLYVDREDVLTLCRNKASGKYFIYVNEVTSDKCQLITPEGRIKVLDLDLFEDFEEIERAEVLSEKLITKQQFEVFDSLEKIGETPKDGRELVTRKKGHTGEPDYIVKYRKMLKNPLTVPSIILQIVDEHGSMKWADLRDILIEKYHYRESGSFGASLRVLRIDGLIAVEGTGEDKIIRTLRKGDTGRRWPKRRVIANGPPTPPHGPVYVKRPEDITRIPFESRLEIRLRHIYGVLYFMTRKYNFSSATNATLGLFAEVQDYQTISDKCARGFAGSVDTFVGWFNSGDILDKLAQKFSLSDHDYNVFKELLRA